MRKVTRRVVLTRVSTAAIAAHRDALVAHGTPDAPECQKQQNVIDGLDWLCKQWGTTKPAQRRFTLPWRRNKVLKTAMYELSYNYTLAQHHPADWSARDATMFYDTFGFLEGQLAPKERKTKKPARKRATTPDAGIGILNAI